MALPYLPKAWETVYWWIPYLNWSLSKGASCSGRALNWVQIITGRESCSQKIFWAQFQVQELVKIFLTVVKIKDFNVRIFYKFLLNIKPRCICCHLNKQVNKKKSVRISRAWSLQKLRYLIGRLRENSWYSSFDFPEARQIRKVALRLWENLVKCYPLVRPTLHFFSDFCWDMSGNWINIYNLCYNTGILKKTW